MKMALDSSGNVNVVSSYEAGKVRIRDQTYTRSLLVLPQRLLADWEPTDAQQLRGVHFSPLLEESPEVVILGTGDTQIFPEPAVFATLMDLGIGFEVMDNGAACRTYNILVSEDRRAALALILPGA